MTHPDRWQEGEREIFARWLPKLIAVLGTKPDHADDVLRLIRLRYLIFGPGNYETLASMLPSAALIQPTPAETDGEVTAFIAAAKLLEDAGWKVTRPSPTPPPIGDGEGPKPVAWHWEASDGQSAWPVWSMQAERPKHAPDTAVPLYDHAAIEALRAERDSAQSMVQAWEHVFGTIEAHIRDRINMRDPADPETYLRIIRGDVENIKRASEQICAARWADYARHEAQVSTLSRQLEEAREALKPFAEAADKIAAIEEKEAYAGFVGDDEMVQCIPTGEYIDLFPVVALRRAKETVSHG